MLWSGVLCCFWFQVLWRRILFCCVSVQVLGRYFGRDMDGIINGFIWDGGAGIFHDCETRYMYDGVWVTILCWLDGFIYLTYLGMWIVSHFNCIYSFFFATSATV